MKWQPEPFTKQDMDLVLEYNRIKKFEVKEKDLGAGSFINVRETLSMDNSLAIYVELKGVTRDHGGIMKGHRIIDGSDSSPWTQKFEDQKKPTMFVGTLVHHNRTFKYNTKTKQFFDRLLKAGRFQQHCILKNKSYHPIAYDAFCDYVEFIHEENRLFEKSMRSYD